MTTFKDASQREWTVRLDFALLQKIRDAAQVDLGDIERLAETWARLLYDDGKALLVLWLAISRAAESLGVSESDFLSAMDGDALQGATDALGGAIESFTQPRKRGIATQAIRGVSDGMARAMTLAEEGVAKAISDGTDRVLGG